MPTLEIGLLGQIVLGDRQRADLDAALATRRKSRRCLRTNLPRVEITLLPPEAERSGLDTFDRIGEDTSETLERRPSVLAVARVIRPKFVRKDRERNAETEVFIAEPPLLPIPRGLAGPGMLADTIVKRWQEHMPLHRLEGMYERDGIELARCTMRG